MLAIHEFAPRRLLMTLSGKIDAGDIEALERALDPYLEDEGSVNAVIDLSAAQGMTLRGLIKDATFEARMLAQLDKMGRLAVVTSSKGMARLPGHSTP